MTMYPIIPNEFPMQPLGMAGDYSIAVRNRNGSVTIKNFHADGSHFLTVVITSQGKPVHYWSGV